MSLSTVYACRTNGTWLALLAAGIAALVVALLETAAWYAVPGASLVLELLAVDRVRSPPSSARRDPRMASLYEVTLIAGIAGCATGIGALPTIFVDRVSHRVYDGAIGFAAGVMVGAAVFALILPGLELGTLGEVGGGIVVGGAFLLVANALLPHLHLEFAGEHREGAPVVEENGLRRAALIGGAITIHNVPEGLAVGIAFASGEETLGLALAFAIAVQNVPDGFAMAVPAVSAGVSKSKAVLYTTLSGGVPEPAAAALGFALVAVVTDLFPMAAGFAAGAMIAVVFRELIPASHGHGYEDLATMTFVAGFVTMMVVDVALAV